MPSPSVNVDELGHERLARRDLECARHAGHEGERHDVPRLDHAREGEDTQRERGNRRRSL